jgi:TrmH family RNA methyltransferase
MTNSDDNAFDLPGFSGEDSGSEKPRREYKPRKFSDSRPGGPGKGRFAGRRDGERGGYRGRDDRGEGDSRGGGGWKERREGGGGDRPYLPRGEGGYKPFNREGGEFKPRGDRKFEPRGDRPYRSRDEGGFKPRRFSDGKDFSPREEGGYKPFDRERREFKPRGERSFEPRGERREFKPRVSFRDFEHTLPPEVSKFLPLKHEKGRYRESRFLIEGAKNISDVVAVSPEILYAVLVAEGFEDNALRDALRENKIKTQMVAERDLMALCDTETPQGVVAVANFGALKPDWNTARNVALIDGVQDPGNLGAILRTAAAMGVDAVVLGKGTCDAYNPKVVRASAAALLRVPLETGEDLAAKMQFLRLKGFTVVATSPHAQQTLEQAKLRRKVALLFGNEGAGVGANLADQADVQVRIPMRGKVESLNVAVAHGLLTHELVRLQEKS